MKDSIKVSFGKPDHGWLPVNFEYNDFVLNIEASDVLNDPTEELYNVVTKSEDNLQKRITWWLEPAAVFFDFEKSGKIYTLIISQTKNLHSNSETLFLKKIVGDKEKIIEPFRFALKQFLTQAYEETNWPYIFDKNKIANL